MPKSLRTGLNPGSQQNSIHPRLQWGSG
jgi:hypothetical protein